MNTIRTSDITANSRMGFTNEALRFLQESYLENFKQMTLTLNRFEANGSPLTLPVILSGCEQAGTATTVNIKEGVIYYQGEVFYSPEIALTSTGGLNTAYGFILDSDNSYGNPIRYDDDSLKNSLRRRVFSFFLQTPTFTGPSAGRRIDFINYSIRHSSSTTAIENYAGTGANINDRVVILQTITKPYDAVYNITYKANSSENTAGGGTVDFFLNEGLINRDKFSQKTTGANDTFTRINLHYTGFIRANTIISVLYRADIGQSYSFSDQALYINEV